MNLSFSITSLFGNWSINCKSAVVITLGWKVCVVFVIVKLAVSVCITEVGGGSIVHQNILLTPPPPRLEKRTAPGNTEAG